MASTVDFINASRRMFYYVRRQRKLQRSSCINLPKGWREIGSGWYSIVYQHKDYPDLVLKISGPTDWGFGVQDRMRTSSSVSADAWPIFAEHCLANPAPNLPNIIHIERVSQNFTWAVMPKYLPSDTLSSQQIAEFEDVKAELYAAESGRDWLWPIIQMKAAMNMIIDLHDGNVMMDSQTGKFILTDPFSG